MWPRRSLLVRPIGQVIHVELHDGIVDERSALRPGRSVGLHDLHGLQTRPPLSLRRSKSLVPDTSSQTPTVGGSLLTSRVR